MKQSLIALAVAGAFAAPVAMAEGIKIGGELDVAYQQFDNGMNSGLQANDTHSRWWMDASDDIGNGMMVLGHFEIDQGVAANRGMNNRNSFIGLKGDFGMVKIGTEEGIYEQLGYQIDYYHGAAGPAGNIVNGLGQSGVAATGLNDLCGGGNPGCVRLGNTLSYVSPNFNGLNFKVDYSNKGPKGSAPTDGKGSVLQAGVYWNGSMGEGIGLRVGAGMFAGDSMVSGTSDDSVDATRFTIGGTIAGLSLDLLIESNKWKDTGTEVKADHQWITGKYDLATGWIAFDYGMLGETKINGTEVADSGGSHMGIGYYHNLSKASAAYVIYSALDNDAGATFNMQDGPTAAAGKDPSSISVGLFTTF